MEGYPTLSLFLAIGLLFGPLAGATAFLITYEEYSHHGLDRGRLIKESLGAAISAACAVVILAVVSGYFIGRWGT